MADEGCCCHNHDQEPARESTHRSHAASDHDCCSHDDVARQQSRDPRIDFHGPMGNLRIACPDDDLGFGVDAQLVLESLAEIDLGKGTEALICQRVLGGGNSFVIGGDRCRCGG